MTVLKMTNWYTVMQIAVLLQDGVMDPGQLRVERVK